MEDLCFFFVFAIPRLSGIPERAQEPVQDLLEQFAPDAAAAFVLDWREGILDN